MGGLGADSVADLNEVEVSGDKNFVTRDSSKSLKNTSSEKPKCPFIWLLSEILSLMTASSSIS